MGAEKPSQPSPEVKKEVKEINPEGETLEWARAKAQELKDNLQALESSGAIISVKDKEKMNAWAENLAREEARPTDRISGYEKATEFLAQIDEKDVKMKEQVRKGNLLEGKPLYERIKNEKAGESLRLLTWYGEKVDELKDAESKGLLSSKETKVFIERMHTEAPEVVMREFRSENVKRRVQQEREEDRLEKESLKAKAKQEEIEIDFDK